MERTEFREQFFRETRTDPYAAMVARLCAQMWAEGYEQALREHGLEEARLRRPFADRMDDAMEFITERSRREQAQAVIALASLGAMLSHGQTFKPDTRLPGETKWPGE